MPTGLCLNKLLRAHRPTLLRGFGAATSPRHRLPLTCLSDYREQASLLEGEIVGGARGSVPGAEHLMEHSSDFTGDTFSLAMPMFINIISL